MELTGYELEPDATIFAGSYQYGLADVRTNDESKVAPISDEEKTRAEKSAAQPNKRFHYRYKAAELAWQAAQMMPDESDQTAQVLCQAGSWLKNRDPKAADPFYKALVRRCGHTDLGRRADILRWFPTSAPATKSVSTAQ
jgi:hypothetical protein